MGETLGRIVGFGGTAVLVVILAVTLRGLANDVASSEEVTVDEDSMTVSEEHTESAESYWADGQLGLALVEVRQALAAWPANPTAKPLATAISARATQVVGIAQTSETINARSTRVQATVVASLPKTVARWTGSGIKTTETFEITKPEWRINWSGVGAGSGSLLQIHVYRAGSQIPISVAANIANQPIRSDTSYVHSGPGRYYLLINAASVEWTVVAEQ